MDKNKALQKLLNGTAIEEEIELLKQGLVSGEISIGGNVNQSVIIIGNGNTVGITPEMLDKLNARSFLGTLDRDLTGDEIGLGLKRLESELHFRAPILLDQFQDQVRRLQPTIKANPKSLSEQARKERIESLAVINGICNESLDVSFNSLCLGEEPPEYDSRSPFRGLESFRLEDREFFFGREALTKKIVAKIQAYPFLAVLGASGSGKSSLVKAGLIPTLGSAYAIFRPGTDPFLILEAIGLISEEIELIVVDQFEELFTLTHDEATHKEFITKLLDVKQKIVITLRSDFLGEVAAYRALSEEIQSHLEIVPPMNMDELRRAMEAQAGQVGLRFEADLGQQILDDVEGEPGAMPLLQHALWELWNRRHGRWLRASEYRAFGGVKQAITSTAEKIYGECTKAEQEQMRDIFLRLTRLDDSDEGRDTRKRVTMNDLIPSGHNTTSISLLLDKLANARLIVKTVKEDKEEIEVAHEALIRRWERLRLWLNENRQGHHLLQHLRDSAHQWENRGREVGELYRGGRLKQIEGWAKDHRVQISELEDKFLTASQNVKKRERLNWIAIAGAGMVLLLTIILAMTGNLDSVIYRPVDMENYWVTIPAGEFQMGSENGDDNEKPVHTVNVDEFQIGKYEVTNRQYVQCVRAGICTSPSNEIYNVKEYELHPVTDVSWYDATTYCGWVGGRLPTEAEWEKAASWDTETKAKFIYPWGDNDPTSALLNYNGGVNDTTPVGTYPHGISPYGLFDMAGNVWEWTDDWYDIYPGGDRSTFTDIEIYKVLRGGSWSYDVSDAYVRSASRGGFDPRSSDTFNYIGFRCARSR